MNKDKSPQAWWTEMAESSRLEMKTGNVTPDVVGQNVCGFANAEGGAILIGIGEGGKVYGVSNSGKFVDTLRKHLADNLSPRLAVSVNSIHAEGKDMLIVDVPQGSDRPYTWRRSIFIRKQGRTDEGGPEVIAQMLSTPRPFHWERQSALGIEIADLDEKEIRKSFNEAQKNHLLTLSEQYDTLNTLRLFHLADGGQITNGAVILFGNHPEHRFPQTRVRAVCYSDSEGNELLDNRILEGNAFRLVESVMDFLRRHTSVSSTIPIDSLQRAEKAAYPYRALQEAILNAVQHRDYEAYDGGISVVVRPNSIEIWNSGALPTGMTLDDLKKGHHSRPHNPDIAYVFFLRGFVERIGSGAKRMINLCRDAGLPDPEWSQDSGGITVVLRKAGIVSTLNDRQVSLIREMEPEGAIATSDFRERFAVSDRQARNDLTDLVKAGYLRRIGSGPTTRYVRTEKELE